jgi:hypothetical protein
LRNLLLWLLHWLQTLHLDLRTPLPYLSAWVGQLEELVVHLLGDILVEVNLRRDLTDTIGSQ